MSKLWEFPLDRAAERSTWWTRNWFFLQCQFEYRTGNYSIRASEDWLQVLTVPTDREQGHWLLERSGPKTQACNLNLKYPNFDAINITLCSKANIMTCRFLCQHRNAISLLQKACRNEKLLSWRPATPHCFIAVGCDQIFSRVFLRYCTIQPANNWKRMDV